MSVPTSYQRVGNVAVTPSDYDVSAGFLHLLCDGTDDGMVTPSWDLATCTSDGLARRNLFTSPSAFDDVYWTKTGVTITANTVAAPDGTTTADTVTSSTTTSNRISRDGLAFTNGVPITISFYAKAGTKTFIQIGLPAAVAGASKRANFNIGTGALGAVDSGITASVTASSNGFYRCVFTVTPTASVSDAVYFTLVDDASAAYVASSTAGDAYLWGAQLETGSTATAFQNIGTDKVTVVAGVRKLSDAAVSALLEFSAAANLNAGSFVAFTPGSGSERFSWGSRGTAAAVSYAPTTSAAYTAPVTSVLTGTANISGDSVALRANGTQVATSASDQGTGNFGNYPLYLFRRGGTTLPFNGRFYGLSIIGAQLSANDITVLEKFQATKTGITI